MSLPPPSLSSALAGRYDIEREIGQGGMATVYLARDVRHERHVALKVLSPELGAVLGAERFLSEIRVTANLQHPNLLPLFDSGEANGLLFYVMPFVDGETLRARLDREKQLPVDDAVRIATALASALAYAHERGIIHRDLKPENILIQAGQPVIADFGIALAVSKAGGARVTQTGLSLGTPQYMSPEQAAGDRVIDGRSDTYSLGAVTYEMLAGEPPHSGTSAQAIIAKLMTTDPRPVRALRATVPVNVASAVERALAKLPADRFSSVKEFSDALANPSFTVPGTAWDVRTSAQPKFRRWFHGSAALAALFLITTIWGWVRPRPQEQVRRYSLSLDSGEALAPAALFGRLALSPDGSRFAYIGGPTSQVMVRSRNQLKATPLGGSEGARAPFFSPDGERVGFMVGRYLRVAPLSGGPVVTLADSLVGVAGLSWGSDGFIYADGLGQASLVRVADTPGAVPGFFTALDSASGEVDHTNPEVLPNGKGVLFTVRHDNSVRRGAGVYDIALADVASGTHRLVMKDACCARYAPSGHMLYVTSAGALMAVPYDLRAGKVTGEPAVLGEGLGGASITLVDLAVSATGTLAYSTRAAPLTEAVWVTRDGKAQLVDSSFQGAFSSPSLSPDGSRLALELTTTEGRNIWVKVLDRGPRLRLTLDGGISQYPSWTPDGRSVTFASGVSLGGALLTKRADGSAQAVEQLRQSRSVQESLWSPDGKWLIFRTGHSEKGGADILALRPGTDTAPLSLIATKFAEATPALSPDGRWLAYSSNESGSQEIYVVPFPASGTAKWAVSSQGGTEPQWSHRSGELFYRDGSGHLVAVEVKTTPTFSMGRSTALFPAAGFTNSLVHQQYAVAPDDRRFLMLRPVGRNAGEKLIVVENWPQELRARRR